MSEVIDAIKVWQEQNALTIKGLDVAKQNAISQALNFFNKKFGGEGELMPIIEEKVIVETPQTKEEAKDFNIGDKIKYIGANTEYIQNGDLGVITDVVTYKNGDINFEVKFESKNSKFMLPKYKLELFKEEQKVANGLIKIKEIGIKINDDNRKFKDFGDAQFYLMDYFLNQVNKVPFRFDIYLTWEDGSNIISKIAIDADDIKLSSYNPMKIPLSRYMFAYYLKGLDVSNGKAYSDSFYENNNSHFEKWDWEDKTITEAIQQGNKESGNFKIGDKVEYIGVDQSIRSRETDKLVDIKTQEIGTIVYITGQFSYVEFKDGVVPLTADYLQLVKETSKVETAINQQIMIPQGTEFELMSNNGILKKGDTGVFAEDYIPPNTFLDAYMNSEARPDFIYTIPFKKIRVIEEAPIEEINQAEEEIVFADLEALENEIESINFEELEQLDKELDDLFN
jgi:hypothetical protein